METERLYLRKFQQKDAENIYELNLDPEVLKFTGDEAFKNVVEANLFIQNYDHYKKYGFGRWAVINKKTDSFLGWCGLKYTESLDEFDIGFRFFRKYWNKGYATESAKLCLNLGFNKHGMKTIFGRAVKENTASIKVLEKIGMSFYESREFHGHQGVIYKIEKSKL